MSENKRVKALYMEDSVLTHKAIITKINTGEINKKTYNWIELSETIFHPKGGGQPSDVGFISNIPVACVHKNILDKTQMDKFDIFHCFEENEPFNFNIGDEVELHVDAATRHLHSRLHTAGHVLAEAVNICYSPLVGYQGNHSPNDSYVKFKIVGTPTIEKEEIKQQAEALFNNWIDQDLQIEIKFEISGLRAVKVLKSWTPCGGTHITNLKRMGLMEITDFSINKKDGTATIKYKLK